MTRFQGGPAEGRTLMIRRAPMFLRVVVKGKSVDALDQITDTPEADEQLYVYRIVGDVGSVHLNIRGGKGGLFPMAIYRLLADQPLDCEIRDNQAWQSWGVANKGRLAS